MPRSDIHAAWITGSGREGSVGASDARFPYWSFTKTIIATCALKLVEAGALDLDAPLDQGGYTLRQLLAHTSGLPDYGPLPAYHAAVAASEAPWSRRRLLDVALAQGMMFEPGQGWSYSNIGYLFARELIEATASRPLGAVIAGMISEPLGLESVELAETRDHFARLHWPAAAAYDPGWVYHGCVTGTAADAARMLHALLGGNLLRPETLDRMLVARSLGGPLPGRPWTRCGYALGLMSGTMDGPGRSLGHSGGGPFSVNAVYHFPDRPDPVTVACFTDGTDEGAAEFAARDIAQSQ
jgi:CubicO group peptidase (beta-lactamase class C family)